MKKKFLGRVLTMLLVASMVFTLLPASAIAAGNWWWNADEYTEEAAPTATADNSYQYNIFFLDCGRKYFSVDSIKALIDNASAASFNYIQLAVGNDGLRLLLDDMNLTVGDNTYGSDAVKAAIHAGNLDYNKAVSASYTLNNGQYTYQYTYSPDVDELTEGEMNTIIAYAKSKGMGVIPCVNTPGHMDAILSAANALTDTNCSYNGSVRTIDVTNETAVAFTKALLQKYITYFQSQGCQLFNMGADEYANDKYTTGGMGFGQLINSNSYKAYGDYINAVAKMIKDAGMTPMAFNDGIYFWDNESCGEIDRDILICYWSSGWGSKYSGYKPMSASDLAGKGFKMVNTNGDYYYVLGKGDRYSELRHNNQIPFKSDAETLAQGFETTKFMGSDIDNPVGSMLCVWSDFPGAETEDTVVSQSAAVIRGFGSKLPKLNTTPVQPDPGITITPEGGTTGTTGAPKLDSTKNESIVLDAGKVVTWSYDPALVTLMSADAPSEVALADFATLRAQRVTVTPVAGASGTATITAKDDDGHSDNFPIEVVNSSATTGVPVELKVGDDKTVPVEGHNYANNVDKAELKEDIATVTVTGKDAVPEETNYPVVNPTYYEILGDNSSSWVKTKYFYSNDNGSNYYPVYAKRTSSGILWWTSYKYTLGYSVTGSSSNVNEIASYDTDSTSNQPTEIVLYGQPTVVPATPASTTITFHGVGEGTTSVTIGGTTYNINVSYYEQSVNVVLNQDRTVEVSGELNDAELDKNVATVSISTDGKTMTVNGVAEGNTSVIVGNTKYLITVSTENLETVTPLKIEYWITNSPVQRSEADATNHFTVSATMGGIATQNGVEVTADTMIPKDGYKKDGGRTVDYWQCRLLDTSIENDYGNGTQKQTSENGDDETTSGVAFTKVRYYGGHWAVYTEKNEWVEVKSNHQLVAYFLEIIAIDNNNNTRELYVNAADWGNIGSKTGTFGYYQAKLCAVAVQTVYEDGATNPEKTDIDSIQTKMLVYGLGEKRGLGTMRFTGENGNKIYKVTAETGDITYTASDSKPFPYSITGVEYDKNEKDVWTGELSAAVSISNPTNDPTLEGNKQNLYWSTTRNDFILIRVYIKAPATEDSLTVHYMDETTGTASEFYNYSINVVKDTVFDSNFGVTNGVLHDNTVVNYYGQPQTVKTDLKEMPEIDATYRFAAYQCERTTRSDDGKHVYLYYKFTRNAAFVADFGLPMTISFAQINSDLNTANITGVTVTTQQYGTVTPDVSAKTITYTPNKTFGEDIESLNVTFSGTNMTTTNDGAISYQVYIYPASNVLYEASFLEQVDKDNGPKWTPTTAAPRKQQTQKVGDTTTDYHVFGRDEAYDNAYGPLGAWTATGLKAGNGMTKALTTNFYGNGFDLIGKCGPKTGSVVALIKNTETNKGKFIDVDTRYQNGDIYQVPLLHVTLAEGPYTVTIYGGGLEATNATPASYSLRGAATYASDYSVDSHNADLYSILAENGLTMADVEYVKVDSAPAAAKTARRATSFYALDTAAGTGTVTHEAGDHVEIDGFRVYRSTDNTNNTNYPEGEKNVQYLNILDAVSSFTAFVEGSGSDADWTVRKDYENAGGPQNEIYLRKTNGENSAIAFKIDPNAIVQISARAVENGKAATLVVNGNPVEIKTNTEMYYTFKASGGIVTIKNEGEGMLALGNLKIKNGTQPAALSEEDYPAAIALLSLNAAPETPDTVFEPTISAKVTTTRFIRSKVVTLTVSASADVAKLTVNGTELRPTNGWLVSMGWSKSYNYILTETLKKSETKTYKIIGYSADGTASTPTVVKSK